MTTVSDGAEGALVTPYVENESAIWNRMLVEKGVQVNEMNRKLPALEDLFLELTGGETID
ncbi:ABC transporter [Mesobacillus boroniphilus JCM 21738]|uniref:ABC transporter n=1 Tax=Mesobacillus boroniphilus JCM 21738 TaxID=1294265 RepID=W4RLR3_9BACI|nr:ABC transporter [Mesobacillus boroniphilus JCM 21738]